MIHIAEATIADLQGAMTDGETSARELVEGYLERYQSIDEGGPTLRSIVEINPEALGLADALDRERMERGPRGTLHGIPVLLKDNIDTADRMPTSAGSLALKDWVAPRDALVARKLRDAGAIILGKTNLSEWANFRSTNSSSGWSGRGGQTLNPYALDRTPCGSSSGSAAAVAAGLAAASLGTETDGSILCPASICGVVGMKPTVGLTSRAGVIPISRSQDSVGPFGRSVRDVAALLSVIAGTDPRDPATRDADEHAADYTAFLDANALRGARIGVLRQTFSGYSPKGDAVANEAFDLLRSLGAEIIDPADLPSSEELRHSRAEFEVMLYEFKAGINEYLATVGPDLPVHSLEDLIRFNEQHASEEMPYFGQELFLMAQDKGPLTEADYREARDTSLRLARTDGIDAVMAEHRLDALVALSTGPAWKIDLINGDHHMGGSSQPAAIAGYPAISVPAGYNFGLPIGITFMAEAFSEGKLLGLAYAFEQASQARRAPKFATVTEG